MNGFEASSKQQEQLSDSEDSSVLLSSLQTRLTEKNRELQQTLQAEQDSLVKTKAYLKQQQETLKRRRVALKHAHKDWSVGAKSSKTRGTAVVSVVVLCCVACDPPIAHNRESAIICSQRKYAQVWKLVAEIVSVVGTCVSLWF